jgi:DNA gyrase subunit B
MGNKEHYKYHSTNAKKWINHPKVKALLKDKNDRLWNSSHPLYDQYEEERNRIRKVIGDKCRFRHKNDKEYSYIIKKIGEEMSEVAWGDPDFVQRKSNELKERWKDPEYREMMSKRTSERWKDPEYREMMSVLISNGLKETYTEERKQKASIRNKKLIEEGTHIFLSPEFRVKSSDRMIQNNPMKDPDVVRKVEITKRKSGYYDRASKRCVENPLLGSTEAKLKFGRTKILRVLKKIMNTHILINRDNYRLCSIVQGGRTAGTASWDNISKYGSINQLVIKASQELKQEQAIVNHKVKSVEFLDEKEDIYDFEVDLSHNFALSSGVFVHNSGNRCVKMKSRETIRRAKAAKKAARKSKSKRAQASRKRARSLKKRTW